jgi:hypothetical protein
MNYTAKSRAKYEAVGILGREEAGDEITKNVTRAVKRKKAISYCLRFMHYVIYRCQ